MVQSAVTRVAGPLGMNQGSLSRKIPLKGGMAVVDSGVQGLMRTQRSTPCGTVLFHFPLDE